MFQEHLKGCCALMGDGKRWFNRLGPRLAESLEILAEMLHPESFDFGHRGTAWESVYAGV